MNLKVADTKHRVQNSKKRALTLGGFGMIKRNMITSRFEVYRNMQVLLKFQRTPYYSRDKWTNIRRSRASRSQRDRGSVSTVRMGPFSCTSVLTFDLIL